MLKVIFRSLLLWGTIHSFTFYFSFEKRIGKNRKLHVSRVCRVPDFRIIFFPKFVKTASREPMREETCDCDKWSPDSFWRTCKNFDKITTFPSLTYILTLSFTCHIHINHSKFIKKKFYVFLRIYVISFN